MSSTVTLNNRSLPRNETSVLNALGEVAIAFKHLATALVKPSAAEQSPQRTAHEEAEELRSYASTIQAQDPNFAQDLFAAADRHEMLAAKVGVH